VLSSIIVLCVAVHSGSVT